MTKRLPQLIAVAEGEIASTEADKLVITDQIAILRSQLAFLERRQQNWREQRITWLAEMTATSCIEVVVPEPRLAEVIQLHAAYPEDTAS